MFWASNINGCKNRDAVFISDTTLIYMIDFDCQNVSMPSIDKLRIADWITAVVASYGRNVGNINYLFCNDDDILVANRQYVGHDYYTDIITFDYSNARRIAGDVLISLDTVASNAELLGVDFDRELLRVIIHGVLHLVGIDDKGPGEREFMEAAENKALAMYDKM